MRIFIDNHKLNANAPQLVNVTFREDELELADGRRPRSMLELSAQIVTYCNHIPRWQSRLTDTEQKSMLLLHLCHLVDVFGATSRVTHKPLMVFSELMFWTEPYDTARYDPFTDLLVLEHNGVRSRYRVQWGTSPMFVSINTMLTAEAKPEGKMEEVCIDEG